MRICVHLPWSIRGFCFVCVPVHTQSLDGISLPSSLLTLLAATAVAAAFPLFQRAFCLLMEMRGAQAI